MRVPVLRVVALAAAALAASGLAACGSPSSNSSSSGSPVSGGTLRMASSGDVTIAHLDPAASYSTQEGQLERGYARQLVTWPASNNFQTSTTMVADAATEEFSGGQRIGVARALALRPKLIICDEPVSALDVSIQAQILNLLGDLQAEFGLSYLFTAHNLPVVRHVSDRVAVMYLGRIAELGSRPDAYGTPRHPYTAALLSAEPAADPDQAEQRQRVILVGDVPSPIEPPPGCHFHPRCPKARERCAKEEPLLTVKDDDPYTHVAACHYPVEPGEGLAGAASVLRSRLEPGVEDAGPVTNGPAVP